jgi:hypothetical protein
MKKLINVIKSALIGACAGLISGLAFGLLIWFITLFVSASIEIPPRALAAFLGMGFGTLSGAIFGGMVGLKEK